LAESKVFTTITARADEVLTESYTDGAGRVRRSRSELPNSAGGWTGSLVEYDILGQAKRSTVPTEIDSNWTPSGDDLTRGFLWQASEYDWKGRVTKQTNTDGTFKSISYDGCGCAGGQVTTVQGEEIIEKDWQGNNPISLGRRTQKIYADILGRSYKTEVMNWNGTVYSTVKSTFNGRDRATLVRQYAGADTSSTYQDVTMSYDGHGRAKTQHRPEQNAGTATTYNYYFFVDFVFVSTFTLWILKITRTVSERPSRFAGTNGAKSGSLFRACSSSLTARRSLEGSTTSAI